MLTFNYEKIYGSERDLDFRQMWKLISSDKDCLYEAIFMFITTRRNIIK